jgi:ArsR family transcriptional regulator
MLHEESEPAELSSPQPAAHEAAPAISSVPLANETAGELVQLFKLLADETRLRILHFLMQQEELNVRTLCELLGQSQPAVSHHLALLRVNGLIECRRDGKHNFYHVVPKRCESYLDLLFAVKPDQTRRIRIEDSVVTYARDGHAGA